LDLSEELIWRRKEIKTHSSMKKSIKYSIIALLFISIIGTLVMTG